MGDALGFGVDFDEDSKTVLISSDETLPEDPEGPSTPETKPDQNGQPSTPPVSYTFTGSGWGHSVGMSQWGAYAMAQQGFTYEEILKFYFTGIAIAG